MWSNSGLEYEIQTSPGHSAVPILEDSLLPEKQWVVLNPNVTYFLFYSKPALRLLSREIWFAETASDWLGTWGQALLRNFRKIL